MKEESLKISFTGDISLSKYYADAKVADLVFSERVRDFLKDSDACVFNVETVIGERKNNFEFSHVSSEEVVSLLKFLIPSEKQIWNIANNHVMDMGKEGLKNTILQSKKTQSCTIGAGENLFEASKPCYLSINDIHVGLFSCGSPEDGCGCKIATNVSPGVFSWNDVGLMKKRIEEIKKNCRWCVIVVHGGNEFHSVPLPEIRKKLIGILSLGADVVVCL